MIDQTAEKPVGAFTTYVRHVRPNIMCVMNGLKSPIFGFSEFATPITSHDETPRRS